MKLVWIKSSWRKTTSLNLLYTWIERYVCISILFGHPHKINVVIAIRQLTEKQSHQKNYKLETDNYSRYTSTNQVRDKLFVMTVLFWNRFLRASPSEWRLILYCSTIFFILSFLKRTRRKKVKLRGVLIIPSHQDFQNFL